jgi:hypothetical protein
MHVRGGEMCIKWTEYRLDVCSEKLFIKNLDNVIISPKSHGLNKLALA